MELVPPDKRDAVERAFRATFGSARPPTLTPLKHGLSPALVFRADINSKSVLLRVEMQTDPTADPGRHFACLRRAADAGVAPRVLYSEARDGVAITEFIFEVPLKQYKGGRQDMLRDIALTVRKLQRGPAFPDFISFFDAIEMFLTQVRSSGVLADVVLQPPIDLYRKLAAAYPTKDPGRVPCHNDLNPTNLLYDGERLWIIDWESGFQGDLFVDLATLANSFAWDAADEAVMLNTFCGSVATPQQRAQFTIMRQFGRLFSGLVILRVRAFRGGKEAAPETSLEAPPVRSFYRDPEVGALSRMLTTPDGQLSYGKALLSSFIEIGSSPTVLEAADLLRAEHRDGSLI